MRAIDNGYSRFVAWVKILLPMAALGLLSSIFLLSRDVDPTGSIPFAELSVDELAREQRISAPNYAGVTLDGTAISFSATTARPAVSNRNMVDATDIRAALEGADGSITRLSARMGTIDTDASQATLRGGVIITTSTGYRITTDGVVARLDRTEVISDGPIKARGPSGVFTAGSMSLTPSDNDPASSVLVFKNGVDLVYTPRYQKGD